MTEVWVYIENAGDSPAEVSLELLGKARELADAVGARVGAVVVGHGVAPVAEEVISRGADRVYLADSPLLAEYTTLPYARAVVELVWREDPQILLFGATTTGRDLAPRVASHLRTGLTADCTDLQIGDHATKENTYKGLLHQIRPAFGGNIIATIITPDHRPQLATVREGVFRMPDADPSRAGEVIQVAVERKSSDGGNGRVSDPRAGAAMGNSGILLEDADFAARVVRRVQKEKTVDLKGARLIVAGGAGVGSRAGFALVEDLARVLGGVVGASRAAVDAGYVGREHQVGQTGTTVRPKLYIAVGISGSVQHRAGMDQSARILAINTDPKAPIFSVAHYGVVGDLQDVIPRMIKAYRSKGVTVAERPSPAQPDPSIRQ